jgi:hypothetical protein
VIVIISLQQSPKSKPMCHFILHRISSLSGCNMLEYVFRPMRLRPMWPMYGYYIATILGLALMDRESISNMV